MTHHELTAVSTPGTDEPNPPSAGRARTLNTGEGGGAALKSGTAPVRAIRIETWESVGDLQAAWDGLLDRSKDGSVFQTYSWHRCWWDAFGAPHRLFVVLAYAGPVLVGIAPMMIARSMGPTGRTRNHLQFIGSGNHASDYCDFIIDPDFPEALQALLDEIFGSSRTFDRIDLSHFPSHSSNEAPALEYFRGRGARVSLEVQAQAPVRILGDEQADLKAAGKASLRRHTAFFQRSGELRFHRCASEAEILGYLPGFFEQHASRWTRAGSPSQFSDPAQQAFCRGLVRELFPRGWLRFDVVLFDGSPLAFHLGFEYRRRFIWYKPTFDIRFASRSPGEVLIKFLLEDAIRRKLEEFDFTVGSESFKYRFANRVRFNDRMVVFRSAGDYWIHRGVHRVKSMRRMLLEATFLRKTAAPRTLP